MLEEIPLISNHLVSITLRNMARPVIRRKARVAEAKFLFVRAFLYLDAIYKPIHI